MKMTFTIIVTFWFPLLVNAQSFQIDKPAFPIDSLNKVLPTLRDTARINCLNELSRSYFEAIPKMQADSALSNATKAFEEASAINYIKGLGDACLRLGVISYWHQWNFIESEKNYRRAIFWHQKIQDDNGLGFGFRGLGASFLQQDSVDVAMKAFEQSEIHFRKAGNLVMLADLHDWFSYVFELKGNFEKRFEFAKKGFQEKKRLNDQRGLIWSFFNLAEIYQSVEDYETALDYLRQSILQARKQSVNWKPYRSLGYLFLGMKNYDSSIYYFEEMLRVKPLDGSALAGLGKLYFLRGEYIKAVDYLDKALAIKKKIDPGRGLFVLDDLGKTYVGMKKYANALRYARECLSIAGQTGNKPVLQDAFEIHWLVYQHLKNTDSAYFYYQKFVALKDSLEGAKLRLQNIQQLVLYKSEARDEQQLAKINLLRKDNELKQQQLDEEVLMKKILITSLVLLVSLAAIIFRNIILKRRNEKLRLENELKEQELISERKQAELQKQTSELEMLALRAQMNPHFLFNCLNSINRFILKNETETASDYLTKFSRLIRMVLNNSQHKYITLNEELDCLELYVQMEQLRVKNSFRYKIKCTADIDTEEVLVPPLLLQPFVENAIWHGLMNLPDQQTGKEYGEGNLDIFLQQKDEILECIIVDNGVGRKAASELSKSSTSKYKSMGLQITKERIALLDNEQGENSIAIEDLYDDNGNAEGTKIILRIKYKVTVEKVFS
ncbi:MAG: histidine kinase [Ginsengibacter sp.]